MNSRNNILSSFDLTKKELIELVLDALPLFTDDELDELYLNIAMECEYRDELNNSGEDNE